MTLPKTWYRCLGHREFVAKTKQHINPFYAILVLVAVIFVVTSFAYGLMSFQAIGTDAALAGKHMGHPLWRFLRVYGTTVLGWQVALLALLTVAAIGCDSYCQRRDSVSAQLEESQKKDKTL